MRMILDMSFPNEPFNELAIKGERRHEEQEGVTYHRRPLRGATALVPASRLFARCSHRHPNNRG